ncbi:MAG: AAA family ATPase [Dehalococcoidia bacterium]
MGRVRELAALSAALAGIADGGARSVLSGGDAGVGETRLLLEFAAAARAAGASVLWGSCHEGGWTSLCSPWSEAFEGYPRAQPAVIARLRGLLGSGAMPLLQIAPSLSGTADGAVPNAAVLELGALATDDARFRLLDAATRFLTACAAVATTVLVGAYRENEVDQSDPLAVFLARLRRIADHTVSADLITSIHQRAR